jgi:hypothetical protein
MEKSLYELALAAYIAECEKEGLAYSQPSEIDSEVKKTVVHLRNGSNLLAVYDIKTGKIKI